MNIVYNFIGDLNKMPHGITLGMSKKEFEKAISQYDFEVEDYDTFKC